MRTSHSLTFCSSKSNKTRSIHPNYELFSHSELVFTVEVLDPMVLSSKVRDVCECACKESATVQIPCAISDLFDGDLVLAGESRRLLVTLGQFSLVRLERDAQLVVPVLRYSLPCKECCEGSGCAEDPCELFSRIPFPAESFNPTGCDDAADCACAYTTTKT